MSRVLKFRIWDKIQQRFVRRDSALTITLDGQLMQGRLPPMGVDRFVLQQFTGLKDKHGREVYEGDIYRNLDNGLIGKFYYLNGSGGYTLYARENNPDGSPYNMLPFMQLDTTNFEVIGTIYENPELVAKERE